MGVSSTTIDAYAYIDPKLSKLVSSGYRISTAHAPWLSAKAYNALVKKNSPSRKLSVSQVTSTYLAWDLKKFIQRNKPDLIIADEPTGNIDPRMSQELVELFMRLNEVGTTVVMVTHAHDLVRHYNKRVIILENGAIAADGGLKQAAPARPQPPPPPPASLRVRPPATPEDTFLQLWEDA
jgi:ABC-type molybdenum transport system ATPase subunit/photorepair protein PhrA